MARFFKKREQNKGLPPGALVFIGQQKMEQPELYLIDYSKEHLEEKPIQRLAELEALRASKTITWLNIDGIHDTELIREVGEFFSIHPLLLEDILNTGQRAKVAQIEDTLLITMKMLNFDRETSQVKSEQLSIVIHQHFLITFQERSGDTFEAVRERIRGAKGRIRHSGTDYLAYALLDTVVDNYIYLVEHLGENIEELELQILENPDKEVLGKINVFKRELQFLSKVMRPAKDIPRQLLREEVSGIEKKTEPFFRDLEDLLTHVIESLDTYRDLTSDYLNMYHTVMSTKMNDVMKVLTIFASIFIPITFFAGVYGMNFDFLPELHFKWAYPIFWAIVIGVVISMLLFFKRRKWL